MQKITLATTAATLPLLVSSVWAHHSNANYDSDRLVTLEGVISEVAWANPHVYLMLETRDESGERIVWEIEGPAPQHLFRKGWTRNSVALGEQVKVTVFPNRRQSVFEVRGRTLTKADGSSMSINGNTEDLSIVPSGSASSIAGIWRSVGNLVVSFVAGHPEGVTSWPLTEPGRAALERFSPSVGRGASGVCQPVAPPLSLVFNNFRMIEIDGNSVSIHTSEPMHSVRTVRMDLDSFEGLPYSSSGISIGHWEGDALVVESSRFLYDPYGSAEGLPGSSQKRLVERFQLAPDGNRLLYSFELTDPVYLAEPVRFSGEWDFYADVERESVFGPCDPENAQRAFQ